MCSIRTFYFENESREPYNRAHAIVGGLMAAGEQDRYPIGRFQRCEKPPHAAEREMLIDQIERAPVQLRTLVEGLDDRHLDTPYRAGGWTIRQVIHHLPDSHMNSYLRM